MSRPTPIGRKCSAKNRQDKPCGRFAMNDRSVCDMHGGKTPGARKSATEARVMRLALKAVDNLDLQPVKDPLTELSLLAAEVVRWKNILGGLVAELNSVRSQNAAGFQETKVEIALFERALDRCNAVLTSIARLNIDERLLAIEEKQAAIVLRAIAAALDTAEVPADRQADAKRVAANYLRALPA